MQLFTAHRPADLSEYLDEIKTFPLLTVEREQDLATRWREDGELPAAHELVQSHLRLVAKIARGYRGYGLPLADLISEGNVGLMQAVERFDPTRGFRFATYAMWWIRAAIQEYILRSWSLVKLGTTANQKKLFFNLRRLKGRMQAFEEGDLHPDIVTRIAEVLDVPESDVISMDRRMAGGDSSLNAPMIADDQGSSEWQDFLVDEEPDQESYVIEQDELNRRRDLLTRAMDTLDPRERHILEERRLAEEPKTLEELSQVYGVSRERIRQIEVRAFGKLQRRMLAAANGSSSKLRPEVLAA